MPRIDEIKNPNVNVISIAQKAPKSKIVIPKYNWVKDKIDTRDYLFKTSTVASPSSVDLRPQCSLIENQGQLGSCTGNAIAGAIELLDKRRGKITDVSRLFIYYYERSMIGTINSDSGAYIRDGIKVCSKYGAPLERLWPYDIGKFKVKPSATSIADAARRKVTLYERALDFNACINALSSGFPVIVGFSVYNSFGSANVTKTGMMPYPDVNREYLLGGHAVLLVGYNNTSGRFIVRNSWGAYWADRGYFYMPYEVIQNTRMSGDFWVIKSVNNP